MKSETILQAFFYSFRKKKTFLNHIFTSPAFQCNSELTSTMTYSEIHLVGSQETWMPILALLHHQVTMHWPSPDPYPSSKTPFECSSFMWFLPCHTLLPLTLLHLIKLFHISLGVFVFDFVLYYTCLLTHCSVLNFRLSRIRKEIYSSLFHKGNTQDRVAKRKLSASRGRDCRRGK